MPSAAGATKAKKSAGVIHEGTARTPNNMPSVLGWAVLLLADVNGLLDARSD